MCCKVVRNLNKFICHMHVARLCFDHDVRQLVDCNHINQQKVEIKNDVIRLCYLHAEADPD